MPPDAPQPLNLIRIFDFYLTLMFIISFLRRWRVYMDALRILIAVRGRWPRLIQRLGEHKSLLLNWAFFRPTILALLLTIVQLIASRVIWPHAVITGPELQQEWWWVLIILVPMIPMLAVDLYFIIRVGRFDHTETVKYLDQAESWLGWKGPARALAHSGHRQPPQDRRRGGEEEPDGGQRNTQVLDVVGNCANQPAAPLRVNPLDSLGDSRMMTAPFWSATMSELRSALNHAIADELDSALGPHCALRQPTDRRAALVTHAGRHELDCQPHAAPGGERAATHRQRGWRGAGHPRPARRVRGSQSDSEG